MSDAPLIIWKWIKCPRCGRPWHVGKTASNEGNSPATHYCGYRIYREGWDMAEEIERTEQ